LNTYATKNANFLAFSKKPNFRVRIAAIRKATPAGSVHDALPWRNFPRMKSHLALESATTVPVAGHSGEVVTPTVSTPPRPMKSGVDRHGFPNREAIVHKALERFLSIENPISRSGSRSSQSASLILSFEVGNYVALSRLA
jgi:hypothetical protein